MSNDAAGDATGSDATALTTATLAGGCFWCLEAVFLQLKGVSGAQSGYAGGRRPSPTYEQVCAGSTGHAEVVRVSYDPSVIAFADLLDLFFTIHDPTTLNRQGADSGTQYRHDDYFARNPQNPYCAAVIAPKVAKARKQFFEKLAK